MDVNLDKLKSKLGEMYPEIGTYNMDTDIRYDKETDAYILTLKYGEHSMDTHLDRSDAEACMEGKECAHLGVQLGRFVKNYCLREGVCPTKK